MQTALHLIHPYVFKRTKNGTLENNEKFVIRDRKIFTLVQTALSSEVRVVHHMDTPANSELGQYRDNTFKADPLYSFLFEGKLVEVVTTNLGIPIADEKPTNYPLAS